MSFFSILLILIVGLITIPFVLKIFDTLKNPEEKAEEKANAKAEEKVRSDKGALRNTFDFVFGENNFLTPAQKREEQKQLKIFDEATERKKQSAIEKGFVNVSDFEIATDPNRTTKQNITQFNPEGLIGFGIKSINNGRGIPDTSLNRALVLSQTVEIPIANKSSQNRRSRFNV